MRATVVSRIGIVIVTLFASAPVGAQTSNTVKVDNLGTCPADNVLTSFPGVARASAGLGKTLVKLPGATLEMSQDESRSTGVIFEFNTSLTVFGFSSDGRKLFVRSTTGTILSCGWVSVDKLLMPRENKFKDRFKSPQPLQMRDISGTQKATENHLNVKAVVHDLSTSGDTKDGIDIFADPASGRSTGKIRLFDAFPVFAELSLPSSDPRQETRYWLIGQQDSGGTTLKGWIRQRDVVIWPSRLAVQWNEAATVSGYSTPDNLIRRNAPMTLPERIERADYPDQITRRLPVLEQAPPPDEIFRELSTIESFEKRKASAEKAINYYKIATPGNACRKDNPQDCISARQLDLKRAEIAKAEKAALRMDILIVMDATESMDPFFASTVHTIEGLIKTTEDEKVRKEVDLRFAIGLYGDYQSSEANFGKVDYREIVPFFKPIPGPLGTSGAMQVLLNAPKSLVYKDAHRDKLEAPYAGVIRGVKTAKWRSPQEVPLRFVIHIGDAGNRDPGRTAAETQRARYPNALENSGSPPQSTIRETYGEKDVAQVLREAGVIYIPLVIQNGSREQPAPTMWNNIFRDQANKIIDLLGIDAPIKETLLAYSLQEKKEVEELVISAVAKVMSYLDRGFKYQKCGRGLDSDECKKLKQHEAEIRKPEVVQLVNRVTSSTTGLKAEEINNIYSRDQSIVTMYSPARSIEGKEMFTHWVALDRSEFRVVRDLLKNLCENMSKQDSKNPVMRALREFAEAYSNEDFTDLSVREILGKRLGIPNLERTDFSGRTREEIDDAYRAWQSGDRETWDNWHLRACKANTFTQLMEEDRKVDPAAIQCDLATHTCQAPEAAQKKFRWSVQVSQDAPTFYVPLDILP